MNSARVMNDMQEDMQEDMYAARGVVRGVLSNIQKQIDQLVPADIPDGLSVSVWIDAFKGGSGWSVRANADLFDGRFENSPNKEWIHADAVTLWFHPTRVAECVEILSNVLLTTHTLADLSYNAAKRIGHTGNEVAA